MNKQEAFNKVWNHFVVQKNPRSVGKNGFTCSYFNSEGHRCAIGVLVSKEKAVELERDFSGEEVSKVQHRIPELDGLGSDFLDDLQRAHDGAPGDDLRVSLTELAKEYNLTIPPND